MVVEDEHEEKISKKKRIKYRIGKELKALPLPLVGETPTSHRRAQKTIHEKRSTIP